MENVSKSSSKHAFWRVLKCHGYLGLLSYLYHNYQKDDKQGMTLAVKRWLAAKSTRTGHHSDNFSTEMAMSAGKTLEHMIDNTNNRVTYWSDTVKEALYGVAPPFQLYLNTPAEDRFVIFYESLESGSILAGNVIEWMTSTEEYVVHILAFADGRTLYIDDLNIRMYISTANSENLAVGCFVQAIFCNVSLEARKMYLTMNAAILKRPTGVKLGVIEKSELPLHYRLSQERPINSRQSYFPKRPPGLRNTKMCQMFNIKNNKIYSLNTGFRTSEQPAAAGKITYKSIKEKALKTYMHDAQELYHQGDILSTLKKLNQGLEIEPDNVSILQVRGIIYGNLELFKKSLTDLHRCLDFGLRSAIDCIREFTMVQAYRYETSEDYSVAAACYARLLKLPFFANDEVISGKFLKAICLGQLNILSGFTVPIKEVQEFQACQALYDFVAKESDEVSFRKGEVIIHCTTTNEGWMIGTVKRTTKRGMLPANYVQMID